ncbi:uncharacterized protein [Rutidosis leptorrhynchoides]|uniref:uncharacterized protein n=1 Tax=Rutidosis leptorrhynchoides TaxID=125765 RepID=UPI003A9997C4
MLLHPMGMGGLNIGALKSENLALLGKWWWRFKTETNALWVKIIRSIYGSCGGLMMRSDIPRSSSLGTWTNIILAAKALDDLHIPFCSSFVKTVGDGTATSFWNEIWVGDRRLRDRFPRLFRLESSKEALQRCLVVEHGEQQQIYGKKLSALVDEHLLSIGNNIIETFRNNLVPKKLEIFSWRVIKKRIPVRTELDKRGIDLHSVRCPLCDDDLETIDHALIFCKHSMELRNRVFGWWGLGNFTNLSSNEILRGIAPSQLSCRGKMVWQAVEWV